MPHPSTAEDRQAGYRYDPFFCEEIIRENLDIGRPDMVQLVFARRLTKKTPGTLSNPGAHPRGDSVRLWRERFIAQGIEGRWEIAPGRGRKATYNLKRYF